MESRRSSLLRVLVLLVFGIGLSAAATADTTQISVLINSDQNPTSGCDVATVEGVFQGVEQVLITTVETPLPGTGTVDKIERRECVNPATDTLGPVLLVEDFPPGSEPPVGVGLGTSGFDVVETYFPLSALPSPSPAAIRLAVTSLNEDDGGEDAVLKAQPGPGQGPPIQLVLQQQELLEIPTLSEWGLILLGLALAAAAARMLRRRTTVAFLVGLVLLAGAGTAWAACVLDGDPSDWDAGDQLAVDPVADAPPGADIVAFFGRLDGSGTQICFRIDIDLEFSDPPDAKDDAFTMDEDDILNGNVLADNGNGPDMDADGGPLTVNTTPVTPPTNGTLVLNADGTFTYTPDADFSGADSFVYEVSDDEGQTDTATVSITVTGANDPPVVDDATFPVAEDAPVGTSVGTVTFTDPDTGQSHTFAITAGNTGGAFAINAATGEITVAAALDFETTPTYSLTVEVTDNGSPVLSGTGTITINVTDADDAPVAVDDAATVTEDDPATAIDVLANDTDTDGGPISIQSVTQPANGTVVITNAGADLTYQPDADYCNDGSPTDDFTYTLNGGSTATVSVTVDCEDDDPVAVDDAPTVAEDSGANTIDVLANDTDVDGGPISIQSVTQPTNGTVVITNAGADLTYEPDADYCNDGSPLDTFTYTLTPGGSTATVSVTVTCADDPPVAVDDAATVGEDSGANTIDVLANDTDLDAGPISVQSVTQPANGTVAITNAGADLTYAPDANYCNGGSPVDTFTYTLNGGSTATVSVTVTCLDDPPLAVNDSATVGEDSGASTIDVLANDTDLDGGPMSVQSVTQPANGTVVITNAGADLTYEPDADYCNNGSPLDTFTYTLNGGSTATVSVTVTCLNDGPVLDLDADDDKGTGGANFAVAYAEGDGAELIEDPDDPNGATITDIDSTTLVSLTVTLTNLLDAGEELLDADVSAFDPDITKDYDTTTPGVGVLTISSVTPQPIADYVAVLRTVTYEHTGDDPDDTTARVVQFVANDGTNDSNTATSTVTLTAVDDPPVAVDDTATVAEDSGATTIDVLANDTDVDGGPISVQSVTQPTNGTVVITNAGADLTYEPDADYCNDGSPTDDFTYTLNGGSTATVAVTVTCADDPPTAVNDAATVAEDSGATTIDVLANDTDPDGGPISVQSVTQPTNGTVVITNAGADLTYEPDADYCNDGSPTDNFTYTLNGGSVGTVSMTVTCVDDDPVAVADAATVVEDSGANTINVLANDTDIDGGPKTIQSVTQPTNGTVVITNAGADLTYEPDANYCNDGTPTDDFTYTLNGGSSTTVAVTVTCVDDPPVAVNDAATVLEDSGATTIDVQANDTDIDGGTNTISGVTQPTNGTVVITNAGADLTYEPDLNYCNDGSPLDTFTYTLSPGGSVGTVSVTVTCVNDAPTFTDASIDYTTAGNTQLRAGEAATGASVAHEQDNLDIGEKSGPSDVDGPGPPFTYSLASGPANGQATVNSDGTFTYEPNAGFHGPTDSFMVNVSDGGTPAGIGVVTVTVTISEMVWYVHDVTGANNPSASDDGRSTNAFDSIAELVAANPITPDDYVFVFAGNTAATPHSTELVIDDSGVKLHGQGVGLTVPGVGNLVAAGAKPRWVVTADNAGEDNAVTVNATAGSLTGVEIRGLDLTGRDNGIDVTATGAFNASVTISDNTIQSQATAPGAEGVDVNAGSTGTVTLAFSDNTLNARGSALDFTRTAGTAFVTAFHDNVVSGDNQGAGLVVNGPVTFDANTTTGGIQAVPGGTTVIGQPGNPIGGAGLSLTSVTGALNFANLASGTIGAGDLDIYTDSGAALSVSGVGGFDLDVTPNAGTLVANAGPAAILSGLDAGLQLSLLTSSTSSSGVSLTTVSGTFSAPSGSSITKSSGGGTAFSVASSSATVSYGGTLSVTSGSGVGLSSNTGATNFTGQLTLNTGTNAAFSATGASGTVTATHTSSTLTTTTGTALNVNGPDIGVGGLVFRSISSNGAASGIILQDTGTTAGLTVSGTGSAGTGGTINSSTGPGVSLTNTGTINLSHVNVQNGGNDGIRGSGVGGLNMTGLSVTSNGNAIGEWGIDLTQLTGSGSMSSSTVSGSAENNMVIANTSGTLSAFNVTNSSFTNTNMTTGDDGFRIENNGSGSMSVSITGSTFTDNKGDHFQAATSAAATGSIAVTFSNNTLTTTAGNDPNVVGGGITISPSGSADLTFTINGNNLQQAFDEAINLNLGTASTAAASMIGTVSNNIIGTAGDVDSGSESGTGISVISNGAGLTTVAVTGNQVFQYANPYGILVNNKEGSTSMNATVTGNTVANPGTFAINGIRVDAGATAGDSGTLCAAVSGNSVAGSGPGADTDIRLRQRFNTTIRLPGYAGANNDTTAVNTFVAGNNAGADVSSAHNVGGGGGGFVGGAACPTP